MTFIGAIWEAQLETFNAAPRLGAAVMASRAGREINRHEVWARLAAKFASGTETDAGRFELVADALAVIREDQGPVRVDALLRLPLEALIRYCTRFVVELFAKEWADGTEARTLCARHGGLCWKPRFGPEPFISQRPRKGSRSWRIEELCSVDALKAEGGVMSHCVASYVDRCRLGYSAVFSVRRVTVDRAGEPDITSYATVEVRPRSRRVLQIQAYENRSPSSTVMSIVREWATAKGLLCWR